MKRSWPNYLLCFWTLSAFIAFGCGAKQETTETEIHLRGLSILYGRYITAHKGQSPKDEQSFKEWIKSLEKSELEKLPIKDPDPEKLFISPRDGEPYVIVYGASPQTGAPPEKVIVAHEKNGAGGKVFAAYYIGKVEEIDKSQLPLEKK